MRQISVSATIAIAIAGFCDATTDRNINGSTARLIYKDPSKSVEARVSDLLSRMTIEDKTAQLVQGDFTNWINTTSNAFNHSGLVENMATKAGSFYVGYAVPQQWIADGIRKAQDYLVHNTTLGIPAFVSLFDTEIIRDF